MLARPILTAPAAVVNFDSKHKNKINKFERSKKIKKSIMCMICFEIPKKRKLVCFFLIAYFAI